MSSHLKYTAGVAAFLALAAATAEFGAGSNAHAQTAAPAHHSTLPPIAAALLRSAIPEATPNAQILRRGQYLVAAGDCMSCHLRDGGEPLAGGLALNTPFGAIYSSNITSDPKTGIGAWTNEQFYRAMHDGVGAQGENLYPAFPYPWFRRISRPDSDAILAYLKTTAPVTYTPPANSLHWPMSIRASVKGWNLLYLSGAEFAPDPSKSAQWNRGAYLVTGPGHCSGCHTPKGRLGADVSSQPFQGGLLENWVAPDLTPNIRTGLGSWSVADIAEYLKTGRNAHAGAGAAMADVITYSTSLLTDADREAIAVYLRGLAPSPERADTLPAADIMHKGAAIYSDVCTACHLENGVGQPRYFPPLGQNAMLQQTDATGLEHLILAGTRIGDTPARPTAMTMPSFAWKLTDQEIADVSTYIRNSWGNHAPAVSASDVTQLRKSLHLDSLRPTANSGDWK
jgi:mono/diheme cytochrome c family protein